MPGVRIFLIAALAATAAASAVARQDYRAIDVTLPSETAGDAGLAVRVYLPATPRFTSGAPLAIFVAGGGSADAYTIRDHVGGGVAELVFAFPGGELDGRTSGGSADQRGPVAQRALADVVRYATGQLRASDGRLITDLASYPLLTANVGLVGWSRGGDVAINALARYASLTREIRWIATHESPVFDNALTGEIVQRPGATYAPADYVPGSCALLACQVQYPTIRWEANTRTGGSLYLDRNGNTRIDSNEPPLPAQLLTGTTRRVFTLSATAAAAAANVFGSSWPGQIATLEEARAHWAARDARLNLEALVAGHPGLAAIVHATESDHVQSAADHPHIAATYNGLTLRGLRWVRLNPDRAYTQNIAAGLPDNPANAALPADFSAWLIPEASSSDSRIVAAAIYELTDRTAFDRWEANLDAVIRPN